MTFKAGQTSLEVVQSIVHSFPAVRAVQLLRHRVGINWRQQHDTIEAKMAALLSGFEHMEPLELRLYLREEFLALRLGDLTVEPRTAWSMTSRLHVESCWSDLVAGTATGYHLPMMNFHPEGIGVDEVKQAIRYLCPTMDGVLLNSGRYHHFYGRDLIPERAWPRWMAEFLGPCILVSPRYIAHRLHFGYATLRLTADPEFKPMVPVVTELLPVQGGR